MFALVVSISACSASEPPALTGEIVFDPAPSAAEFADSVIHIDMWEYDPDLADAPADRFASLEITDASGAPVAFAFDFDIDSLAAERNYYVTVFADMNGNGTDDAGDYNENDFYRVFADSGIFTDQIDNRVEIQVIRRE